MTIHTSNRLPKGEWHFKVIFKKYLNHLKYLKNLN